MPSDHPPMENTQPTLADRLRARAPGASDDLVAAFRPAIVRYAFGYLGDMMIQFIAQHDETPSIYRDMYAAGEEGYHHHGLLVHDYEGEKQRIMAMGFELACELHADNVDARYIDTRAWNGGFTEVHADPQHILASFAGWRRAHELRKPGDPNIMARP